MLGTHAELVLRADDEVPSDATIAAEVAALRESRRAVTVARESRQSGLRGHVRDALEDYRPGDLLLKPLSGHVLDALDRLAAGTCLQDHVRDALEDYKPGDLVLKPLGKGISSAFGKLKAGVVGPGESKRLVVESPWSQFTSECQRFGLPPRLDK
eukprot:COSAG01_NODE_2799_length_7053_cov_21.482456_11_plen_155_part_00